MEEHLNKKLEVSADRMMKGIDVEKPSADFTTALIQRIEELETKKVTSYKPLISKPVWAGLGIVFMVLIYVIASGNESANSGWLNNVDFSVLTNNIFTDSITSFTLPKTMVYAIGLFGLMFCIQIPVLKHYFDKRFQV